MEKEDMTVREAYTKLKDDMAQLRMKLESDAARTRNLPMILFAASIIVIGTLFGVYANMTVALLSM